MGEMLRWGILSTAAIGRSAVVPAIRNSRNGTLVAVASRNPDRAKQFAAEFGMAKSYGSYEELLADPGIDAIYNPLPNSLHAPWTLKAAEAGKAVLCEKPLTIGRAEAEKLLEACAALRAPVMEAFMYRFHPQHGRVREIIAGGAIGDVVEVRAHLSANIAGRDGPLNVRFVPDLGGGTVLDMGCYGVSICRMIFGEEPRKVTGWWHLDPQTHVDLSGAAMMEFSGGRLGIASASFVSQGRGFYSVIGTRGVIELPRAIIPGQGDGEPEAIIVTSDRKGTRSEEILPPVDQYQIMVEAFADAVLGGRPVPLPNADSIANMRVLDAWARSARSGRPEVV